MDFPKFAKRAQSWLDPALIPPATVTPVIPTRRPADQAWELYRDHPTVRRLKDGDQVRLKVQTLAEQKTLLVPAGTTGVVTKARCPRIKKPRKGGSRYYAMVETTYEGAPLLFRVPQAALDIL